jgi:hypothetical protein
MKPRRRRIYGVLQISRRHPTLFLRLTGRIV